MAMGQFSGSDSASIGDEQRYAIRYRRENDRGRSALLVEDPRGNLFLFSDGILQFRLDCCSDQARRLRALMKARRGWQAVPEVAPYTLGELRQLMAVPPARGSSG